MEITESLLRRRQCTTERHFWCIYTVITGSVTSVNKIKKTTRMDDIWTLWHFKISRLFKHRLVPEGSVPYIFGRYTTIQGFEDGNRTDHGWMWSELPTLTRTRNDGTSFHGREECVTACYFTCNYVFDTSVIFLTVNDLMLNCIYHFVIFACLQLYLLFV